MKSADGRFMELHVAVCRAVLSAERDFGNRRARLANEPDFLANLASLKHFEPPRKELQSPLCGARRTPWRFGFRLRPLLSRLQPQARRFGHRGVAPASSECSGGGFPSRRRERGFGRFGSSGSGRGRRRYEVCWGSQCRARGSGDTRIGERREGDPHFALTRSLDPREDESEDQPEQNRQGGKTDDQQKIRGSQWVWRSVVNGVRSRTSLQCIRDLARISITNRAIGSFGCSERALMERRKAVLPIVIALGQD